MTSDGSTYLSGRRMVFAVLLLAFSNLMVALDLTIANVAVPHISGNLGISPDQGTSVITSYTVAEAISVKPVSQCSIATNLLRQNGGPSRES